MSQLKLLYSLLIFGILLQESLFNYLFYLFACQLDEDVFRF